jgi:hypothetical protein
MPITRDRFPSMRLAFLKLSFASVIIATVASLLGCAPAPAPAPYNRRLAELAVNQPPPVALDFPEPSSVLDIEREYAAKTPPVIWLLEKLGLKMTTDALSNEFNKEMLQIETAIETEISDRPLGYLLKVEMYTDEFGTPYVPSGQLVLTIGLGSEPLDALAEFLRKPVIRGPGPGPGLKNNSQYIWVRKQKGHLIASSQAPEFRAAFEADAQAEARRREILGAYYGAAGDGLIRVQRAAYWNDVAQRYVSQLADDATRQQVAELTREFSVEQDKFNNLYIEYQQEVNRLSESQGFLKVLDILDRVTGVVAGACRVSELVSESSSKPASENGQPIIKTDDYRTTNTSLSNSLLNSLQQGVPKVNAEGEILKGIEVNIRAYYDGVQLPATDAGEPPTVTVPRLP